MPDKIFLMLVRNVSFAPLRLPCSPVSCSNRADYMVKASTDQLFSKQLFCSLSINKQINILIDIYFKQELSKVHNVI